MIIEILMTREVLLTKVLHYFIVKLYKTLQNKHFRTTIKKRVKLLLDLKTLLKISCLV